MHSLRRHFSALESWSPPLVRMALVSAVLLLVALIGLAVDTRVITGAPAWLKPAKFGLSVAVYLLSLAWMVRDLPRTPTLRRTTSTIAWIITAEVLLICVQAARGTTSHFNADTPIDSAIFSAMGLGIATVWIASAVILWQHWRAPSRDTSMAMALRFGLALNILGAGVGWTMTRPFPGQIEAMQRGERPYIVGAHTVGARDGGPGLPVVGWSIEHGDLRVPHFLGMHALQVLPILLLMVRGLRRTRNDAIERTVLVVATSACSIAFVAALLQALRGLPLLPLTGSS
ncbi:MAG: hypothetical protein Q8K82_17685 [Gemmatimonadaceae bacterium]|nr:hypothetical protein [Gemmatimonadaceae bacterium]